MDEDGIVDWGNYNKARSWIRFNLYPEIFTKVQYHEYALTQAESLQTYEQVMKDLSDQAEARDSKFKEMYEAIELDQREVKDKDGETESGQQYYFDKLVWPEISNELKFFIKKYWKDHS